MARHTIAKLVAPRARQIVRRGRVLSAIERALRDGSCWLAAPGGYGKTIAIIDYLQKRRAPYVWYRVDEGDQDAASFFHYLAQTVPGPRRRRVLPVFGSEYADQLLPFARRFLRAYLATLAPRTVIVLDDLHHADVAAVRQIVAILLHELPPSIRCLCASRTLPPPELTEHIVAGRLAIVREDVLRFSVREARALVAMRLGRSAAAAVDVAPAGGWAAGLVLLAEQKSAAPTEAEGARAAVMADAAPAFAAFAGRLIDDLPRVERELLMTLSLLPEIRPEIAGALGGTADARATLEALLRRQLLVTRGESAAPVFHLHDLLREYLRARLAAVVPAADAKALKAHVATVLDDAGYGDAAVELAIDAEEWPLARRLLASQAERLLAQGRRQTVIDDCAALPPDQLDGSLCYWLGVAHAADDATAESWFTRAWSAFSAAGDARGLAVTAAHAVLSKADSWRTHEGLAVWTARAIGLLDREVPDLAVHEQLLVWTGMLRAADFADTDHRNAPHVERLTHRLSARLAAPEPGDSATWRLLASEAVIEHAGTTGQRDLFERAVDSVAADLRADDASPWALGLWLVAFGAISSRYFAYTRRGFPYPSPESALRAAVAIGQRESLRGVEFGALYHLQLQMKSRSDFDEFAALIDRLAEIADSRYTTQVAVVADCQAALHTIRRDFAEAHRACDRFMAAIEAANEPPLERWPHFITKFQVLLAERRPDDAAEFLAGLLPLFSGALRQRTQTCIDAARVCAARWSGDPAYPQRLRDWIAQLRAANWPAILLNVPALLAELCADALAMDIEPEFCRALIARRSLAPPAERPPRWPWPLEVHLLGGLRLVRDGAAIDLGRKPPMRALEILRVLAVARDHACSTRQLHDWLWPDADGDQAKAAAEQALHRLRRLLGRADLLVQREGQLRLPADKVWVDLDYWSDRLAAALALGPDDRRGSTEAERAIAECPGALEVDERMPWLVSAGDRLRHALVELVIRTGQHFERQGELARACALYLRGLDLSPGSQRCDEALVRARRAMGETEGALPRVDRPAALAAVRPVSDT